MDRDQQRKNKRKTVSGFSCTAGAELTPLKSPTGRPGADCDPTPTAPVPLATVTPAPCPAPLPVPLNLPPGLTVSNDAVTAYCPSTGGYSVTGTTASTAVTGAQQQIVLFTTLANITDNQLNYLYEVVPTSSTAIIAASLSGATSSVIDLTHLNYAQSEELIITIQGAKFTVDALAVDQARNLLLCQVENDLQYIACPTSAYFGATAPTGLPYVPSATSSTGSVLVTFALTPTSGNQAAFTELNIPSLTAAAAQANSIALAQAESTLRCVYGNAATAAACCTSQAPSNNLGFTNCVPATGPTIPGSATAVGYFSVPQNTVFSVVSLNEANSVARELSRNSLNCYFPSVGVTATCEGTGSTGPGATGLGLTGTFAGASTTSVYLDPGSVILYDLDSSVTAANEQAATIALASLNCFWSNEEQIAFCLPSPGFTAINNQYYILSASATASLHYSSTVPADTVISYTSKGDANAQALELASANVSCTYCNNVIPPTCSGGVNATVGAESDLICNVSAEVAQNTAISLGNSLISTSDGGANCCYGNEGVTNTNKCTSGAYYSGDPNTTFTSADSFFIPANVITLCASVTAPPTPPLLFPYSSLFATDVAHVGCCSDILLCGGITGSATSLPPLWAYQTDLFNAIATGATFYTDDDGATPYTFPAGTNYVTSRSGSRAYRAVTGGTGYTVGLTACGACEGFVSYVFRGATAVNYASATAAYADIFCGGPTAYTLTLYTNAPAPFASVLPAAWFSDACGLTAFNPVSTSAATGYFYAGSIIGSTGYMVLFSQSGGNTSSYNGEYLQTSCPAARYPYSVYVGATSCSIGGTAMTLYGSQIAPNLFTSYTGTTNFYTQQLNDSSAYSYPSGTGYITYIAPDTSLYSRPIFSSTARAPALCTPLYKVTVQYSNTAAADVCNHPNYFGPNDAGIFNANIRTVWSDVLNPFTDGNTAKFYTTSYPDADYLFKPGASGSVYISEFSPGDTYRNAYREYTWSDPNSTLKSYTGTFKPSPFLITPIWAHSYLVNLVGSYEVGNIHYTKFLLSSDGCTANNTYSDIKVALPTDPSVLDATYKKLPIEPVSDDVYSNTLLFDGIGYELSSSASGTAGNSSFYLNDLTRVGAGFTGAIVRAANSALIGDYQYPGATSALPTYISSINTTSGLVNLGGYYNKVNTTFSSTAMYVTGFKVDASAWSGSQFTCSGDLCDRIEVGHSLFSYYVGASLTASIGYVTRVDGNTVHYTGAPGYNNFSSFDIGTGASHGSGHVYIQGRQFVRFWEDEYKTQPLYFDLQSRPANFMWSQTGGTAGSQFASYTVAKNLVTGNTAGSTAEFIVAGVNYASTTIPPRPYDYDTNILYDVDDAFYYQNNYLYSCTGSVATETTIVPSSTAGVLDTCCDLVAPLGYSGSATAVSACVYSGYSDYDLYSIDPAYFSSTCAYIPSIDQYWSAGTPLNGTHVIQYPDGYNQFMSLRLDNGSVIGVYPCGASQTAGVPSVGGSAWMRLYLGYYDSLDPYAPQPFDPTYPGGGTDANNPTYWTYNDHTPGSDDGYVFKEYVPDTAAATGCNCGNFVHIEYGLTSGYRYSIWPSTAAAWSDVDQLSQISGDTALMAFNECSTGCSDIYICTNRADCDEEAPGGAGPAAAFYAPDNSFTPVTQFHPSSYDSYSTFDFGAMPSVGGTAEDLKAEATQIAQNIVNSFVSCFYFNDDQTGATCSDPSDYLVNSGYANAGEVISNISKEDANDRAKQLADSRTICINPDLIGGPGCASTVIDDAEDTDGNDLVTVGVSFPKTGCTFSPTLTVTTSLTPTNLTFTPMTICDGDTTVTRYLLGVEEDDAVSGARIPLKYL